MESISQYNLLFRFVYYCIDCNLEDIMHTGYYSRQARSRIVVLQGKKGKLKKKLDDVLGQGMTFDNWSVESTGFPSGEGIKLYMNGDDATETYEWSIGQQNNLIGHYEKFINISILLDLIMKIKSERQNAKEQRFKQLADKIDKLHDQIDELMYSPDWVPTYLKTKEHFESISNQQSWRRKSC